MIDFDATLANIRRFRDTYSDTSKEWVVANDYAATAWEVVKGWLQAFSEDDNDAFSRSFVGWTKARNLLVLA